MSQIYADRRRTDAPPVPGPDVQVGALNDRIGNQSMEALMSGAERPSARNMGHRVDLPSAIQAKMEHSFQADLSGVQLYESQAVADAGAQAVTMGSRIAFAPGKLDFASSGGQNLLGHELSHVVSQARGEVSGSGFLNDHALEARADQEGAMAAAGESVYSGPVTPLSASSVSGAAGPMQARKTRKANSKEKMMSNDFDKLSGVSQSGEKSRNDALLFNLLFGTHDERTKLAKKQASNDIVMNANMDYINANRGPDGKAPPMKSSDAASYSSDTIGDEESGKLKGKIYRPTTGKNNGKSVILYSGSGGSNEDQMQGNIEKYLKEGFTVYCYDYGGFGESTTGNGGQAELSEASMQKDSQRMYDHVLEKSGGNASDVLLHGFSMGGSMAAMVARNAAIKASKSGEDKDKLGGLVLESVMKNTTDASAANVPVVGALGGAIASKKYGSFDTEAALEEISQVDSEMPITFISGSKKEGDLLADERTGLSKSAQKMFGANNNIQVRNVEAEHLDSTKLSQSWDDVAGGLMERDKSKRPAPAPAPEPKKKKKK